MKNNLQYTSQRLKGFNARMKLRASMITVGSVVSLRMSMIVIATRIDTNEKEYDGGAS